MLQEFSTHSGCETRSDFTDGCSLCLTALSVRVSMTMKLADDRAPDDNYIKVSVHARHILNTAHPNSHFKAVG